MYDWYNHPIDHRAHKGGEKGVDAKFYRGGEFLPFYVPRIEMPQVDEDDYPALFEFLDARGVGVTYDIFDPKTLKAHQKVNKLRVESITEKTLAKPVLVSQDGFVLDGNHRRQAHIERGTQIWAYVIQLDFEDAIKTLFEFPKTYSYTKV